METWRSTRCSRWGCIVLPRGVLLPTSSSNLAAYSCRRPQECFQKSSVECRFLEKKIPYNKVSFQPGHFYKFHPLASTASTASDFWGRPPPHVQSKNGGDIHFLKKKVGGDIHQGATSIYSKCPVSPGHLIFHVWASPCLSKHPVNARQGSNQPYSCQLQLCLSKHNSMNSSLRLI